jgi:hypothetical protein
MQAAGGAIQSCERENQESRLKGRRKSFPLRRRLIVSYVQLEHELRAKLQYAWAPIAGGRSVLRV